MNRLFVLVSVLVLVAAVSCDGGGGGGSSTSPVPLDKLDAEFSAAICEKVFECCSDAERMAMFMQLTPTPTDQASCETSYSALVGLVFGGGADSIMKGRILYSADNAGCVLGAVRAPGCATSRMGEARLSGADGCNDFITSNVENDAACQQDYECKSGNCEGAQLDFNNAANNKDGVCKPMPSEGQACPGFKCADELYCDFGAESKCLATKANGMDCDNSSECKSDNCGDDGKCAEQPAMCQGK